MTLLIFLLFATLCTCCSHLSPIPEEDEFDFDFVLIEKDVVVKKMEDDKVDKVDRFCGWIAYHTIPFYVSRLARLPPVNESVRKVLDLIGRDKQSDLYHFIQDKPQLQDVAIILYQKLQKFTHPKELWLSTLLSLRLRRWISDNPGLVLVTLSMGRFKGIFNRKEGSEELEFGSRQKMILFEIVLVHLKKNRLLILLEHVKKNHNSHYLTLLYYSLEICISRKKESLLTRLKRFDPQTTKEQLVFLLTETQENGAFIATWCEEEVELAIKKLLKTISSYWHFYGWIHSDLDLLRRHLMGTGCQSCDGLKNFILTEFYVRSLLFLENILKEKSKLKNIERKRIVDEALKDFLLIQITQIVISYAIE